jgi:hypothetical protein
MEWQPQETAIEHKKLLVSCLNRYGKTHILIAFKTGYRTFEIDDHWCDNTESCWCDTDDENIAFAPPGSWVESTWEGDDCFILSNTEVKGWQELPEPIPLPKPPED